MSNHNLDERYKELHAELSSHLLHGGRLAVVEAPPGSGKTFMLLAVVADLVKFGRRVAIAAQTNRQADDIARRWAKDHGDLAATRFASSGSNPPSGFPSQIQWITTSKELPTDPGLVISTSAKWTTVSDPQPFDLLAVDEAWQMAWGELMQCANLSEKFFLIGDPGQIPPVVTIDVRRWATAPRPPHKPAPEVVIADADLRSEALLGSLPACRRLPHESVKYVKPFYRFDFDAYAPKGERKFLVSEPNNLGNFGEALGALNSGQPVLLAFPTPEEGLPAETDSDLAQKIRDLCVHLVENEIHINLGGNGADRRLLAADIGICSTHRAMNGEIQKLLPAHLKDVSVDTPERWQGLERPVMIVVHPLSNVDEPSDFDLETGRLCVMASRHQVALIVVTRDHVGETLGTFIPQAAQGPGLPDVVGRGHAAHWAFWRSLAQDGRVFAINS